MALNPDSTNQRPYSVSELAFALKRTIEEAFGFVRLRAEISKVTFHGNGHIYLDLKDEKSAISGVVWKGSVRSLAIRPQSGLEVIVTGRITTFPGRSQYQIVIETMEPAGVGALLAQLERLKARLAAEGLFEADRKRPLPLTPQTLGVITSPTGAVIRDILHRVSARWPCRVVVWPVLVQGDAAAGQVRAAIEQFSAPNAASAIPRPDVLIVARGGGSVEDLWPFNDEALARAVAACPIPIISAIGHETDTTLIDFVADRRAPTPTAAAEMATPVRADLLAGLADREHRMIRAQTGRLERTAARLEAASSRLPRLPDLLALATQRLDGAAQRLASALAANVSAHRQALSEASGSLRPPLLTQMISGRELRLAATASRLKPALDRRLERAAERLRHLDQLRRSFDPDRPLTQGFARIERADGRMARSAAALAVGETVSLIFQDGRRHAVVDPPQGSASAPARKRKADASDQGLLFESPDSG